TPVAPPEKTPKEPSKRHAQKKDAARKLQRQTVVLPPKKPPIPDSTEAVRPEGTEGQSARSPRWLPSRWPEAPPPGRFSRSDWAPDHGACRATPSVMSYSATFARTKPAYARAEATTRRARRRWRRSRSGGSERRGQAG